MISFRGSSPSERLGEALALGGGPSVVPLQNPARAEDAVALAVAHETRALPYPFAMTAALAASTAFMTPVSSPVNTLVVTPGNYTFGAFVRVGVPLSAIVLLVCVVLVPLLLPL
jgi:hypothetical protein